MALTSDFTQTVTIQVSASTSADFYVRDLSVSWSTDQPISSADFIIEDFGLLGPVNQNYGAVDIGQGVFIQHQVGGTAKLFAGRIVSVNEQRGDGFSFKRVKCKSFEDATQNVRFLNQWKKTAASTVVKEAWNEHAVNSGLLQYVALDGVETNTTIIEEYTSEFDSLFDLMEQVCKLTDWSWRIEPMSQTLEFFDPLTRTGPAIAQDVTADAKIEAGTLEADKSLSGVFNVYRGQAWRYRKQSYSHVFQDGECVVGFPYNPDNIGDEEVLNIRIVQEVWRDQGIEVKELNEDEGLIRLNKSIIADQQAGTVGPLTVEVEHRGLVWVERIDEESVLKYGRLDAPPISEDGGADVAAVEQNLDAMLRYRASPAVDLSLNVTSIGWNPNEIVTVTLNDPQLQADMYVTGVSHTVNGNDMTVALSLTSPFEVINGDLGNLQSRRSRSKPDPVYEMGKRLERLERRSAHPAQALGKNSDLFGVFQGAVTRSNTQGWSESIQFDVKANIADTHGWSETLITNEKATASLSDTQGWSGDVVLGFSQSNTQGWSEAVTSAVLTKYSANNTQGWSGTVSTATQIEETFGDTQGWGYAIVLNYLAADTQGWTGNVTPSVSTTLTDTQGWTGTVTASDTTTETVNDTQGWSYATVLGYSQADTQGWAAGIAVNYITADNQGWSASLALTIGQTVTDTHGWSGNISTATILDRSLADTQGWSDTITATETSGIGLAVDDGVALKGGLFTVDDDVALQGYLNMSVNDDIGV